MAEVFETELQRTGTVSWLLHKVADIVRPDEHDLVREWLDTILRKENF